MENPMLSEVQQEKKNGKAESRERAKLAGSLLAPCILLADLLLLLGCEIVRDVEALTDLLGRLALLDILGNLHVPDHTPPVRRSRNRKWEETAITIRHEYTKKC